MSRYPNPLGKDLKKFSGNQIAFFSFFLGPVTAVYFLKRNYQAMGDEKRANETLRIGLILTLIFFLFIPFIPESVPPVAFAAGYAFASQYMFKIRQEAALENIEKESSLRAFGISLLCLLVSMLALLLIIFLYVQLGLIDLKK